MAKRKSARRAKSDTKKKLSRVSVSRVGEGNVFAQRGVSARRSKGKLRHIPWNSVELEQLNPLLQRQFVVGRDVMVARVLMKRGCIVPEHCHANEQVTYILEGALKFWIDGKEIVVNAGEVLTIPSNMPHKAEALSDTVDLDVFTPPRRDWMEKDDRYLR
ncbi:MAG: cupin domain-containing protein [Acidobacteria bacterium]|nr:cupin domain-containing protein [Acidobacteriota bacterium]